MILKECRRCGVLVSYPKSYCDTCQKIVDEYRLQRMKQCKKKNNRDYNKTRDPKYIRFYKSAEWRTLSAKYTQDKGYRCEECGQIATNVHHKKAIQTDEGWSMRLDYDNLELLCVSCHNKRHERYGFSRKRRSDKK